MTSRSQQASTSLRYFPGASGKRNMAMHSWKFTFGLGRLSSASKFKAIGCRRGFIRARTSGGCQVRSRLLLKFVKWSKGRTEERSGNAFLRKGKAMSNSQGKENSFNISRKDQFNIIYAAARSYSACFLPFMRKNFGS